MIQNKDSRKSLALIGAGYWGKNILKTLNDLGVLKLVVDFDQKNLKKLKEKYSCLEFSSDYKSVLEENSIKAVAIATPAQTHYQIVKDCIEKKKDVFVEKPFTLSLGDSKKLVELAQEKKKIIMIGHLLLYQPAIQFIKKYLDENKLGKIYNLFQKRLNFGKIRNKENVLWSLGVHDIALIEYLVSPKKIEEINFVAQSCIQREIADQTFLHISYQDKIQAHIHNSWLWPLKERNLIISGEKGFLIYEELKQKVFFEDRRVSKELELLIGQERKLIFEGSAEPLKEELKHFLSCINSREEPISSGQKSLGVMKILEKTNSLFPVS